jgi:PKD repeat protein
MRDAARRARGHRWKVGVAAALAVASVLGVVDMRAPAATAGDGLAPLAFGAFPQPRNGQTPQQAVTALENTIGRPLEVVRVFETWSDQFPDSYHNFLKSGGRTLILSIKPNSSRGRITWPSIANAAPGSTVDNEIRSWARRIRDFQAPIYVTLHHEPESTSANAYGTSNDFIAAWRHWVDVFRQEGATNAKFMWIMTDYSYMVPSTDRRHAPKWYPGDEWIDAMAIDAYNWHVCRPNQDNAWKTLAQIIEPFRAFGALHPSEDMWLAEWGTWEDPQVANRKAGWIDQARELFKQPSYAQFKGITYFNADAINPDFPNCLWYVSTSTSATASFRAMAQDPWYAGDAISDDPPPPVPPTASFTSSCTLLSCTFTSTSTDPDSSITDVEWDFGDTAIGSGSPVTHDFVSPGTYEVSLTVTDSTDLSTTTTQSITVSDVPPPPSPVHRASAGANSTTSNASITVPASVVDGDRLVLVVTAAAATTATTPAGWTLLGTQSDGTPDMRSWVFTRTAAPNTAGSVVTSTLGTSTKVSRVLLAYDDGGLPTAVSAVAGPSTIPHATPPTSPAAGSIVLSYWSDKTDANTGWTLPAGVQSRASSVGSGTARITAAAADAVALGGAQAGATANSTVASSKAIMWSIVVPLAGPPPPNQAPTAAFSSTCNGLTCTFSAAPSTDPDGTIAGATWDFGDGSPVATGVSTPHTFPAAATYSVTVTVTDDDGEPSAPFSQDVVVAEAPQSPITFVGAASTSANATSHRVVVPGGVQAGDALVLAMTINNNATIGTPSGLTGWQVLGTETNGSTTTRVWTRAAAAGTANAALTVTTSATAKSSLMVAAYRGTSQVAPIAAFDGAMETAARTAHTTPAIGVTSDRSWVVWYWAHEDATTTALVPPGDVTVRATGSQTGSGRITALLADSNGAAGVGTAAGRTATAAASTSNAAMWSIVLAPA